MPRLTGILRKIRKQAKDKRLLVIGLDNAGKSTLVARLLQHQPFNSTDSIPTDSTAIPPLPDIPPTFGFAIHHLPYPPSDNILSIWDIGGQRYIRSYWDNYYDRTDVIIWVIDCTELFPPQDHPSAITDHLGFTQALDDDASNGIPVPCIETEVITTSECIETTAIGRSSSKRQLSYCCRFHEMLTELSSVITICQQRGITLSIILNKIDLLTVHGSASHSTVTDSLSSNQMNNDNALDGVQGNGVQAKAIQSTDSNTMQSTRVLSTSSTTVQSNGVKDNPLQCNIETNTAMNLLLSSIPLNISNTLSLPNHPLITLLSHAINNGLKARIYSVSAATQSSHHLTCILNDLFQHP